MVGKRKNIVVLNRAVICINLFETNYWIKGLYVYEKKMCYKIIMPIGASYVFIKQVKREVSAADALLIKQILNFIIRHLVCDTSKWKISNYTILQNSG